MYRKVKRMILVVTLLGVLFLAVSVVNGQSVQADGRDGMVGEALWERLLGLVQGPWVGQFDTRLYVGLCETLEYSLLYGNNGPAVTDAAVRICLPSDVEIVEVQTDPVLAQETDADARCIQLAVGDLPSGGGGSIKVFVQVRPGTSAGAELTCTAVMLVGGVEKDQSVSSVTYVRSPQIESEILTNGSDSSVLAPITRCTEVLYTLVYTNTGNMGAANMTVTMTLPNGFQFRHAEPELPTATSGGALVWRDLSSLAADIDEVRTLDIWAFAPQNIHTWPSTTVTCSAVLVSQLCAEARPEAIVTDTVSTLGVIRAGPCAIYLPQVYRHHDAYYWPPDDPRSDNPYRVRDHYEYDDTPLTARVMLADGQPTEHTLNKPWDEDWIKVYAYPGVTYRVEVYNLRGNDLPEGGMIDGWLPHTDTVLKVYEPRIDPSSPLITGTLVCESDDVWMAEGDFGSSCSFEADTRGWYFIQIRQYDPLFPVNDPWKYSWALTNDGPNRWKRYYLDNGYWVRISEVDVARPGPAADREM